MITLVCHPHIWTCEGWQGAIYFFLNTIAAKAITLLPFYLRAITMVIINSFLAILLPQTPKKVSYQ